MRLITTIVIAVAGMAAQGGVAPSGRDDITALHWEQGSESPARSWETVHRDDPADSLYRAAREALNDNDYRRAANMFREVQRRFPQSQYVPDAMYYQAFALSRTGSERDLRTALRVLEEQKRRFPNAASGADAGALMNRIRGALARRGDPDQTAALLGEAKGSADSARGSRCADENDDGDMRIAALNALLQMDSEEAMPILKQVLARRDACSQGLRRKAVFLVAQKEGDAAADILLDAARNDPDVEVRRQAVFWLSEVRSDRAIAALDSILHGSKDEEVQEKAIFAIANTGSARGMEILRSYALSDAPDELRGKAVFWIGQHAGDDPAIVPFMRTLFDRTESEEIQNAIFQGMAQADGAESGRWLLDVVQNDKHSVETRKRALFWAGQRESIDIATLLQVYGKLTEPELKEHFIFVLSERSEPAAMDKLLEIAKTDRDVEMRKKALFWLAQKNDPRAKKLLLEIINQ